MSPLAPASVQGLGFHGLSVEDIIDLVQARIVGVTQAELQPLVDSERDRALAVEANKADKATSPTKAALEEEVQRAALAEEQIQGQVTGFASSKANASALAAETAARAQADTNIGLALVDKADLQPFNTEVSRRTTGDAGLDKRLSHLEIIIPTSDSDTWIGLDGSDPAYQTLLFGIDADGDPFMSQQDATGRWGIDTDSDPYFDSALAPLAGVAVLADADNDIVIDTGG